MRKYFFMTLVFYLTFALNINSQTNCCKYSSKNNLKIVFYNVENLFDTVDDPLTDDQEFLPGSEISWNNQRYMKKLTDLSKVLISIDSENLPGIIGLAEVENFNVVEDLIKKTNLKKGKYRIIHSESPDERGIDVALIYRKSKFKPIKKQFIPIQFPSEKNDKTRDILYFTGMTKKKDTLHVFVNHWPSRWGGKEKSEPKRMYVARVLKSKVDSVFSKNIQAKIVIIGDFNDEPVDKSLSKILRAKKVEKTLYPGNLYNLMFKLHDEGLGSYYYWRDKKWNMLDQIIVSGSLFNKEDELRLLGLHGCIHKPEWILFENKDGIKQPNRTIGASYYGGYSDHLPVYINLLIK